MKLAVILSAILLMALSCERNIEKTDECYTTLTGKWKFTQYYVDPGDGSGTWQPAPAGQTYVEFSADGRLASDVGMLSSYTRYDIKPDSSLLLSGPPSTNTTTMYFKIKGSTLELDPLCFEGCGFRFKRQ